MSDSNNGCLRMVAYVLAFLLILASFALFEGKIHDSNDSPGWPSVEGNLITSDVSTWHHTRSNGDRYVDYTIKV